MKKLLFAFFLSAAACFGQTPTNIQKVSGTVSNGPVNFGSGNTLSAGVGATVDFTGATLIGFGGGGGGVSSVALALPSLLFNVSGSPVTGSGTLTGAFATQTANTVLAGPTSGSSATPTMRALVAADIPSINSLLPSQSGQSGKVLGTNGSVSSWVAQSGGGGTPGGSSGQIQFNNSGSFGGFTASGDATINTGTGVVTLANVTVPKGGTGNTTFPSNTLLLGNGSSALQTVTIGNNLAISGGALNAAAGSIQVFDVVSEYNGSGCGTKTTGSITTSTNSLVVASASTFKVNQGILVKGAGAAGANLVTSITTIVGTTLTLGTNASTSVTNAVVQHDDTVAITNAINAATTAAGGLVYLTKIGTADGTGVYRCNGPINGTSNCIVTIPWDPQSVFNPNMIYLSIEGENNGSTDLYQAIPNGGVTIDAQDAPTGSSGQIQAVIGNSQGSLGSNPIFNGICPFVDSLQILVAPNPTISGLNFQFFERASIGDHCQLRAANDSSGPPSATIQPTQANTYGVILPTVDNAGSINVGKAIIAGFYTGIYAGEHTRLDYPNITFCMVGMAIQNSFHAIVGYADIEYCPTLITADNQATVDIVLQSEIDAATRQGGGTVAWSQLGLGRGVIGNASFTGQINYECYNSTGNPPGFQRLPSTPGHNVQLTNLVQTRQGGSTNATAQYHLQSDGTDSSGNGINLTQHGTVTYGPGHIGNAATFDGSTGYLEDAANTLIVGNADEFTVACWVNFASLPSGGATVISQANAFNSYNWVVALDGAGAGNLQMYLATSLDSNGGFGALINCTTPTTIAAGGWHFVVAQASSVGGYIRISVDNGAWGTTTSTVPIRGGQFPLRIGGSPGRTFMPGSVDEVNVYNRLLSDVEISQLYNSGMAFPGLISGAPALTSGATGVTQTVGDNTTKLATDAFVLANASGSTGISGATTNAPMYATSATTGTSTAALSSGQILIGSTGNPPVVSAINSTANQTVVGNGAGSITIALAGPHNFTTQTSHGVLVGAGTGAITATTPVNNAVLITDGSGVPSESTTLPTGLALQTPASGVGSNLTALTAGNISAGNLPTNVLVGSTQFSVTQANSFVPFQAITQNASSTWVSAKADSIGTSEGVAITTAASGTVFTATASGTITGLSGLTAGLQYYVSDATAGAITSTPPNTTGHYVVPIFFATSTTTALVNPQYPVAVGGGGPPGGSANSVQYNNAGSFGGVGPTNNAVVVTSGSGVPSEATTLPSGLTIPGATLSGATISASSLTVTGNIFYGSFTLATTLTGNSAVTYPTSGTLLSTATAVTVPQGGMGDTSLAAHGVLVGNGTGAVSVTTTGNSGYVLTSNGAAADPTFQPASGGSTGISGATNNGAMYATGATTGTSTAALTNGQILIGSTGTTPVAATISGTSNQIGIANAAGTITASIVSSAILPGSPTVATPGTSSGSIATIDGTQTLTNKSIAGSEINSGTVPAAQLPLATTGAFGAVKPDGSSITISAGVISSTGGGGSPGGSDTQVQYNNSGAFGANSGLVVVKATGALTQTQTSLGTTPTPGMTLTNTTNASSGNQQVSPSLVMSGNGWGTSGGTTQSVATKEYVLPVQGSAPSAEWHLQGAINGGSFADIFKADSLGNVTFPGTTTFNVPGNFILNNSGGNPVIFEISGNFVGQFDGLGVFHAGQFSNFGRGDWGVAGTVMNINGPTVSNGSSPGTYGIEVFSSWAAPTLGGSGGSFTTTDAFNGYFQGPVAAGSNMTITRSHTLGVVDSTSATSSLTGAFIVAAGIGTPGTSVGIGGGNVYAGGTVTGAGLAETAATFKGTVTLTAGAGTITSAAISTTSVIILTLVTASGTNSYPQTTAGSGSATVAGLATDAGTYNWRLIQ